MGSSKQISWGRFRARKLGVPQEKRSKYGARPGTGSHNQPGKKPVKRPEYADRCLDYLVENRITTVEQGLTLGQIVKALGLPTYVYQSRKCREELEAQSLVKTQEVGDKGGKTVYYLDAEKLALIPGLPPAPPEVEVLPPPPRKRGRPKEMSYMEFKLRTFTLLNEVEQTLGQVLDFPWYMDDQKNFPGATVATGVCIGEHETASLAMTAATTIYRLREMVALLVNGVTSTRTQGDLRRISIQCGPELDDLWHQMEAEADLHKRMKPRK